MQNFYYFPKDLSLRSSRQETLLKVLKSWEKTPFRHFCGIKKIGVDCTRLIAEVFKEVGVIDVIRLPKFFKDNYFLHNDDDLLLNCVKSHMNVIDVGKRNPMLGDIAFYHFGKSRHGHCAVFSDAEHVYQSIGSVGVQKLHWKDKFLYQRLTTLYRIIE